MDSRSRKKQKKNEDPYAYVARLFKYRIRSEKELRERLRERYSEETVNEVIEKLKEKGILDDKRFAVLFAKDELNLRKHGPWIIKQKLKGFGIDEEIIDEAIEEAWKDFNLEDFLKEIFEKKKDPRKVREYLFRRGFDLSILDNVDFDIDRR